MVMPGSGDGSRRRAALPIAVAAATPTSPAASTQPPVPGGEERAGRAEQRDEREGAQAGERRGRALALQADEQAEAERDAEVAEDLGQRRHREEVAWVPTVAHGRQDGQIAR